MSKRGKTVTSSYEPASKKIADENLQETQETIESIVHHLVKTVVRYNSNAVFVDIVYI